VYTSHGCTGGTIVLAWHEFPGPPLGVNVVNVKVPTLHVHSPSPSSRIVLEQTTEVVEDGGAVGVGPENGNGPVQIAGRG
jgi:hypothetical protein